MRRLSQKRTGVNNKYQRHQTSIKTVTTRTNKRTYEAYSDIGDSDLPKLSGKSRDDRIPDPELRRITQRRADGVDRLVAMGTYKDRNAVAKAIETTPSNLWHILNEGRKHSAPATRLDGLIDRHIGARETPALYGSGSFSDDVFSVLRRQLAEAVRTTNNPALSQEKIVKLLRPRMEAILTELDAVEATIKAESPEH